MKHLIILLGCILSCVKSYDLFYEIIRTEWAAYKFEHVKNYTDLESDNLHLKTFMKSKLKVAKHHQKYHRGEVSYTIGINQFSDMLPEELKSINFGLNISADKGKIHKWSVSSRGIKGEVPTSIDWREKGGVTPVQRQGECGSCWAFAAVASLEGQVFRKTGNLIKLSEQQLVDCDPYDNGCEGGLIDTAFKYIEINKGISTEKSYPYSGSSKHECIPNNDLDIRVTDYGSIDIEKFDEEAMMKIVYLYGPISAAITLGISGDVLSYTEGIFDDKDCYAPGFDHGVTIVGYGTSEEGIDYWLIKNSFGTRWGDKGYFKVVRNKNMCKISEMASYPRV